MSEMNGVHRRGRSEIQNALRQSDASQLSRSVREKSPEDRNDTGITNVGIFGDPCQPVDLGSGGDDAVELVAVGQRNAGATMAMSSVMGSTVTYCNNSPRTVAGRPLKVMRSATRRSPISCRVTSKIANCVYGVVLIARTAYELSFASSVAAQRNA
jgi:hypothetical protein